MSVVSPMDEATITSPRFPQELFDAIIDELHSDKKTLATCSVVCKAWLPSARTHLFAFVRLHLDAWARLIQSVNSHSSVIPPIRHLYITGASERRFGVRTHMPVDSNKFSNVVSLSLCGISFNFFSELVNFICAFPSLRTFRILRWIFYVKNEPIPLPLPPCSLQDLYLDNTTGAMKEVLVWLLSCEKTPAIRNFFWHKISSLTEHLGGTFLRAMGSSLERISFGHSVGNAPIPFDLSCNSQLRFIHFDLEQYDVLDWDTDWVNGTLSLIQSNRLEEVSISLIWHEPDEPELLNWKTLDIILAQPRFSQLKKVEVFYHGRLQWVDIEERLPGCYARGILCLAENGRNYCGFLDF